MNDRMKLILITVMHSTDLADHLLMEKTGRSTFDDRIAGGMKFRIIPRMIHGSREMRGEQTSLSIQTLTKTRFFILNFLWKWSEN